MKQTQVTKLPYNVVYKLKESVRKVHCLTNPTATLFTANAISMLGGMAAVSEGSEQISQFVLSSQALLVNLGQSNEERFASIRKAVLCAEDNNIPWVLDPVKIEMSEDRQDFLRVLLTHHSPGIIRCNRREIKCLCDMYKCQSIEELAEMGDTVYFVTGEVDYIYNGKQVVQVDNGDKLMSSCVTLGCALGGITALLTSVLEDLHTSAIMASLISGVAGELAAQKAKGPGTFMMMWLDELYNMSAETLIRKGKVYNDENT